MSKRTSIGFLPDHVLSQHWVFRTIQYLICTYSKYVHNFSVDGWHKLPMTGPALLVSTHTSHSADILICVLYAQRLSGRVVRGLLHRILISWIPILRYVGLVPGHRDSALQLLREGYWVAVVPGGAEEISHHISNHGKQAYSLHWTSHSGRQRAGFAEVAVAMGPGFPVFPCFCENGEEMKWNPLFALGSFLRFGTLFRCLTMSLPRNFATSIYSVSEAVVWAVSQIGIPIPVQVTQHIGDPVVVQPGETADQLRDRVHQSLQRLIDIKQGRRHRSFSAALEQRYKGAKSLISQPRRPSKEGGLFCRYTN